MRDARDDMVDDLMQDGLLVEDTPQYEAEIVAICKAIAPHAFVAGGAARYYVGGWPDPSDIDIYFWEAARVDLASKALANLGYTLDRVQVNATLYVKDGCLPVQIVNPTRVTAGNPLSVISNFTFTTEMYAIWWYDNRIYDVRGHSADQDTEARVLRINNLINPVLAAWRVVKYTAKGYHAEPAYLMPIFQQIMDMWLFTDDNKRGAIRHNLESLDPGDIRAYGAMQIDEAVADPVATDVELPTYHVTDEQLEAVRRMGYIHNTAERPNAVVDDPYA